MVGQTNEDPRSPWLVLIGAVAAGVVAVLASILAFDLLVSDAATRAAEIERVIHYMYWSQPFIYIMAGLIAGSRDARWGPVRAPVIGLVLASLCWMALRKQNLLPPESDVVAWLLTAGALFCLGGAMVAPLVKDQVSRIVIGIFVLGILAFGWALLNLGSVSGKTQREIITRVAGQTRSMETVPVAGADVALLDDETGTPLYTTQTNSGGRYHFSGLPIGQYSLRVWDPATGAIVTNQVVVDRTITGGTPWENVSLPTLTEETGALFE